MTSILFIQTTAPHSSVKAQEGLDALLMGSAFTACSVLFLGNGVTQLTSKQDPEKLGLKNFAQGFSALVDYGVTRVYCRKDDLEHHNLAPKDLLIEVEVLSSKDIRDLIHEHDTVLSF